jgi:hypothetical protein
MFEKNTRDMLDRKVISSIKDGRKKVYHLTKNHPLQEYRENIEVYLTSVDNYLDELEMQYRELPIDCQLAEISKMVKLIVKNSCGLDLDRRFGPRRMINYEEISKRTNIQYAKIVEIIRSDASSMSFVNGVVLYDLVDLRPLETIDKKASQKP